MPHLWDAVSMPRKPSGDYAHAHAAKERALAGLRLIQLREKRRDWRRVVDARLAGARARSRGRRRAIPDRISTLTAEQRHALRQELADALEAWSLPNPSADEWRASWTRVRGILRPPLPLSISQWADRHRVLGPSSPMPGLWRTDVAPFLREIMDSLSPDSGVELTVVMKPVQVGATEVLLNTAAYYLAHAPATVMIVQPNQDMSKRLSRQRVGPMIELSPVLKAIVATQRSTGGNEMALKTTSTGGTLVIASARSAAGLRSLPARIVLADEIDSYLTDLGEGNPFDLAAARATTFGSQKRVAAISTPTYAGQSLIERLYRESDQRKWFVPCPMCSFEQTLEWENLRWEPGEPETARYRCVSCNGEIAESQKAAMVAAGCWKPNSPQLRRIGRGFHFNSLISPWLRWSELVRQYEAAVTPEQKKSFTNLVLALPWQETVQPVPEAETLRARSEPYLEGTVPAGGCFLTAGVDVQSDRVECEIVAWGRDFESWSVAYHAIHGDITQPDIWNRLDELLSRSWPHASGMPMQIQAACVDASFAGAEVTAFTRHKHGRRIYATKGLSSAFGKPIWPRRASYDKNRMPLYMVSSDEAKLWVANRMRIEQSNNIVAFPGFMHTPLSRPRDWFEQLTVEKLVLVKGQRKWVNALRARNEAFDCRALAVCALHARLLAGLDLIAWCDQFEAMLAPPKVSAIAETLPERPKPNGAPAMIIKSRWMDF
jgi:phage terminase large subunit GpA-like protein